MQHKTSEQTPTVDDPANPPGIVISYRWEEPQPPAITAFIWGGKVRPVPALPFGHSSAA
jgi:hypothetical protein